MSTSEVKALAVFRPIGGTQLLDLPLGDGTFPEVSRIFALRGADVLLMPHAARMTMWTDESESVKRAAAPMNYFLRLYAARAYENG